MHPSRIAASLEGRFMSDGRADEGAPRSCNFRISSFEDLPSRRGGGGVILITGHSGAAMCTGRRDGCGAAT